MKKKRMLMAVLCVCLIGSVASAGTLSSGTDAPTSVVASGGVNGPNYTKIFADGARTDGNEGRGNEIFSDSGGSLNGYTMDALVLRKDDAQDFKGVSGASLTLYVFEGTKEQWDLGDGQADGDLWDLTGITTVYTETFALTGTYAEGDYITLTLDTSITMAADMGFFAKMTEGTTGDNFFRIAQYNYASGGDSEADGYQYQAPDAGHLITGSPLEYYAVGVNNNIATNVSPTGDVVDPAAATAIEWGHPLGYTPDNPTTGGYDLIVRKDDPNQTEPNFLADDNKIEILDATATSPESIDLSYGSTYWCSLTAYEPNTITNTVGDYTDDIPHTLVWSFTTIPFDTPPVVTLDKDDKDYITWPATGFFPYVIEGAVDDDGEGDIDDIGLVEWAITAGPGIPVDADARMVNRTGGLFNILSKQYLFRDFIGTECSNGVATSDVLTLTLSGLPAGDYTWTSYHYDCDGGADTFQAVNTFDVTVTVNDPPVSTTTTDVSEYTGVLTDPNAVKFTTPITSDGSDVTLQFVGFDDVDSNNWDRFMMNALELTSTTVAGNPLLIDFGTEAFIESGYDVYSATDQLPETFVDANDVGPEFSAFDTQITVTPDWNAPGLEITAEGGTPLAPTATVDTTGAPKVFGPYTIELTATENGDDGQTPQSDSDTMEFQVAEDPCSGAQLQPGFEFDAGDIDQDCDVDLQDFATLAGQWLNDLALSEEDLPVAY